MGLVDKTGDPYAAQLPSVQAKQTSDAQGNAFPQLMSLLSGQDLPYELGQLKTAQAITPGFNDLAMGELARLIPKIGPMEQQLGAGQAAGDIANLNTFGIPAGQALRATDASANPEFYNALQLAGGKFTEALNALSPGLSAGQRAEVERGTARLNPTGSDNSAVSTAEKAMNFGQAHQNQVNNFANAVNSLSSNLGSLRSGLTPTNVALGRDSRSSPTMAAITPVTKSSNTTEALGGNMWNDIFSAAKANEAINASKFKDWGDTAEQDSRMAEQYTQAVANIWGGAAGGGSGIAGMSGGG